MTFKKTFFEESKLYCKCIPAVGESVRKHWATATLVHRRRQCIFHLKRQKRGWRTQEKGFKKAWLARKKGIYRQQQRDLFDLQQGSLNSYTSAEVNWIHKTFRMLCHSQYCDHMFSRQEKAICELPISEEISSYGMLPSFF